jgi:hypothetical protein
MKPNIPPVLIIFALVCFALVQNTQAVSPPPDGGYPGANTAEGQNALLSLSSGTYNTAVGFSSLKSNTIGNLNTAIGVNALSFNTIGYNNTATGVNALYSNTTGIENTASGAYALFRNTGADNTATGAYALFNATGGLNTATGAFALFNNTTGGFNTATGYTALANNTTGDDNTATGAQALAHNVTGSLNTAVGFFALWGNVSGHRNTAIGYTALESGHGSDNTAVGAYALSSNGDGNTAVGSGALIGNLTGSLNTALGQNAGQGLLDGNESNNIDIGANVEGVAGESNTIRLGNTDITDTFISGISGTTVASGAAVLVDSNGHLGTVTSSKRFKEEIRPMNKTSEAIFSLEPVTFCYKKEIDPAGTSQFGLVAEEVEKINPDLVVRDKQGKTYSVRYEAVNAMLLNEFLKEHRKNEEQQATIAQLKSGMEALTATVKEQAEQIQKVSAQLEVSKATPRVVNNP